jgi:hypothetical protein
MIETLDSNAYQERLLVLQVRTKVDRSSDPSYSARMSNNESITIKSTELQQYD